MGVVWPRVRILLHYIKVLLFKDTQVVSSINLMIHYKFRNSKVISYSYWSIGFSGVESIIVSLKLGRCFLMLGGKKNLLVHIETHH